MAIMVASMRIVVMAMVIVAAGTRLGAEPGMVPLPEIFPQAPVFRYATDDLWQYLRRGLNYLESPKPLAEPEAVPPSYVHPDGRGFGCYGFSPEAYEDVQRLYPWFRDISWEQIIGSSRLYDLANRAFCDWLLKNLQDYCEPGHNPSDVFDVVQKAWNLGLSGFQKGRTVVFSRTRRAEEFKSTPVL